MTKSSHSSSLSSVRVRFAPSPGALHAGNALCALGNDIFCCHHDGHFLLRSDDTAQTTPSSKALEDDLAWLGIHVDARIQQSTRMRLYQDAAERLKKKGAVYPCYEDPQELEAYRQTCQRKKRPPIYRQQLTWKSHGAHPYWRFALSGDTVTFEDAIQGSCRTRTRTLSDPVVLRADGTPTYALANVVDDHLTNITHIIRGRDHLTNTGVHIEMMKALDASVPIFAHHGLLGEGDVVVLSKRYASQSLATLREQGMLGSALREALTQSHEQERHNPKNIMPSFLRRQNTFLDMGSFWALNRHHVRALSLESLNALLKPDAITITNPLWTMIRDNISTPQEICFWWRCLQGSEASYEKAPSSQQKTLLSEVMGTIAQMSSHDASSWESLVHALQHKSDGKTLLKTTRYALTGASFGPPLAKIMTFLGHKKVLTRMDSWKAYLHKPEAV